LKQALQQSNGIPVAIFKRSFLPLENKSS